eukprot:TRINITY_DN4169_c0_g1_i2.p1 TRINITY_DN4169_c0_g1~~TRINITY_DN4169_c0_g1_i2.p1  ORF type:complete len:193 (+),score=17.41 TRINITY_DN4169_c0_g1_i2:44-580(+)
MGVIHNDIQLRHVLLDANLNTKLKGFELALPSTDYTHTVSSLIPVYSAPETLKYGTFSEKSDVYGYGILLWQMAHRARKEPFDKAKPLPDLVNQICSGRNNIEIPNEWPLIYRVIIQRCLISDASCRPDFNQIEIELQNNNHINLDQNRLKQSHKSSFTMGPLAADHDFANVYYKEQK